ncbi:MAG TPA: hypothetical protein VEH52_01975 [Gaiellaceae bacterium]|nr:hypothetical protein [Gaiellaceae bacterium]
MAVAAVVGIVVWRRQSAGARSWTAKHEDLSRRCLLAVDEVLASGSVVTGKIEALAAEARSLEASAPNDAARVDAGRLRERLDELAKTLESDRTMRLASPPPREEQLSYSTALIRQQVEQLQGVLRPPPTAPGTA